MLMEGGIQSRSISNPAHPLEMSLSEIRQASATLTDAAGA